MTHNEPPSVHTPEGGQIKLGLMEEYFRTQLDPF